MLVNSWVDAARLTVTVGHFGSGRTEFSVNLALALGAAGHPFALADLDIVDPYFCARECKSQIEAEGGRLIASSNACFNADVPALPPEVMTLFDDPKLYSVLDIGGDAAGARVLVRYRQQMMNRCARVLCVINANRPFTDAPEKAAAYVKSIEATMGVSISGLVNNTHMCEQTQTKDILHGAELITEVSSLTGKPVVCHCVPQEYIQKLPLLHPIFPMRLYLKKPWQD